MRRDPNESPAWVPPYLWIVRYPDEVEDVCVSGLHHTLRVKEHACQSTKTRFEFWFWSKNV